MYLLPLESCKMLILCLVLELLMIDCLQKCSMILCLIRWLFNLIKLYRLIPQFFSMHPYTAKSSLSFHADRCIDLLHKILLLIILYYLLFETFPFGWFFSPIDFTKIELFEVWVWKWALFIGFVETAGFG